MYHMNHRPFSRDSSMQGLRISFTCECVQAGRLTGVKSSGAIRRYNRSRSSFNSSIPACAFDGCGHNEVSKEVVAVPNSLGLSVNAILHQFIHKGMASGTGCIKREGCCQDNGVTRTDCPLGQTENKMEAKVRIELARPPQTVHGFPHHSNISLMSKSGESLLPCHITKCLFTFTAISNSIQSSCGIHKHS